METSPKPELKLLDPLDGREGTIFDKPAPTGPPSPPVRKIPQHLGKVIRFFEEIIADEGLLLDLCVDRAVGIVELNYKKRAFGSDLFSDAQPTPAHFIGMSAPLAVELYQQVLRAIEGRQSEYEKLLDEAKKELERGQKPASSILLP